MVFGLTFGCVMSADEAIIFTTYAHARNMLEGFALYLNNGPFYLFLDVYRMIKRCLNLTEYEPAFTGLRVFNSGHNCF